MIELGLRVVEYAAQLVHEATTATTTTTMAIIMTHMVRVFVISCAHCICLGRCRRRLMVVIVVVMKVVVVM